VTPLSNILRFASSAGGALLGAGTQGVAALRPARKPLHPDGDVLNARIYRRGSDVRSGVPWLDESGEDEAVVRLSRAIGLPRCLPDIHGLAVRVHADGGDGDLLFATTGRGRVSRFLLTASRHPRSRPLTTLLPYDTDSGALLIAADGAETGSYELSWARPAGEWHGFGTLLLSTRRSDPEISFDPMRRQIPGLRQYPSVRRLRAPGYIRARRSRAESSPTTKETNHVN
jgi:hypothetical protein